jgi:hypothetical protein
MQAPPNGRFTPSEPDDQGHGGDVVDTVQWNTAINRVAGVGNVVGGMVTVRVAPVFSCTSFICSGVTFQARGARGTVTWDFTYAGPLSRHALKKILQAGARIVLKP